MSHSSPLPASPERDAPGRLSATERHDLRGILAAIASLAEVLEDEISGPLNEAQKGHVERILFNVERMTDALERLNAGSPSSHPGLSTHHDAAPS